MLKVFIVDDESIIREGLRDNIPWQQYGYEFVGEASDGEMALPMIRKLQPDVLITDIKMPFMDGLALSRIVSQDFPDIRIIIISGYDEFEYAQQAIRVGVEQYLLKPVTRNNLQKVLSEIRGKIEAEHEQKNYLEKFQNDMQEYEHYTRRSFMEKVFGGQLSTEQIYNEAAKLSIDLNGSSYNLLILNIQEKVDGAAEKIEEELLRYFLRFPEYMVFRWSINSYVFMIKGDKGEMSEYKNRCIENITQICTDNGQLVDWYVAIGEEVDRLSQLADCYSKVNHLLAHRFLLPSQRVFTNENTKDVSENGDSATISQVDTSKVSPDIIKGFLAEGTIEDIDEFVTGYLSGFREALRQKLFRGYLLLNFRFATLSYVETLGVKQDDFLEESEKEGTGELSDSVEDIEKYMKKLLNDAMSLRNDESANQSKHIMKKALDYIEENYSQDSISLNSVSSAIGVSSNYFSGIFSQEMEKTFIEYVTQKRMDKAKMLLKQTELHSNEIAAQVGYKDSHYFSFVFKKTQGCTPREYRNSKSL